MNDDVFALYQTLWRKVQREGIHVFYESADNPRAGGYHPGDRPGREPKPRISITRPYYRSRTEPTRDRANGAPLAPPDLLEELITLAHEYGHHLSFVAGNRTPQYVAAMLQIERYYQGEDVPALSDEQCELVRAEERRAWVGGRAALAELAFGHFGRYDERTRTGLGEYEKVFAWEPNPTMMNAVQRWCIEQQESGPPVTRFHDARAHYLGALVARAPQSAASDASFLSEVWGVEKTAIAALKAHKSGQGTREAVIEAVRACVDRYTALTGHSCVRTSLSGGGR